MLSTASYLIYFKSKKRPSQPISKPITSDEVWSSKFNVREIQDETTKPRISPSAKYALKIQQKIFTSSAEKSEKVGNLQKC